MHVDAPAQSKTAPLSDTAPLFDPSGRRTAANLRSDAHERVRGRFICNQPAIDYAAIHARISQHLNCPGAISPEAFQHHAERILQNLTKDPQTAPITQAVAVPFFLPAVPNASSRDIGTDLEHIYLPAVARSYEATFPAYSFTNHHKPGLTRKLTIAPTSRHDQLLARLEQAPVVGSLFITLTEFSLPAAREQMSSLPTQFLLAGGHDLCAALIGSPDLLLRKDGYPPLLWMAGLAAETETAGYHFEAYGYDLTFNRRVHFGQAAEYWASALVVLA